MITGPAHAEIGKTQPQLHSHRPPLRHEHAVRRDAETRLARRHHDGHAVMMRALPDYDALFGIDTDSFTPTPAPRSPGP